MDLIASFIFQVIFGYIHYAIVQKARRRGKAIFYWICALAYGLTVVWFVGWRTALVFDRELSDQFYVDMMALIVTSSTTLLASATYLIEKFVLLTIDIRKQKRRKN